MRGGLEVPPASCFQPPEEVPPEGPEGHCGTERSAPARAPAAGPPERCERLKGDSCCGKAESARPAVEPLALACHLAPPVQPVQCIVTARRERRPTLATMSVMTKKGAGGFRTLPHAQFSHRSATLSRRSFRQVRSMMPFRRATLELLIGASKSARAVRAVKVRSCQACV